jgi:hypothetical protein
MVQTGAQYIQERGTYRSAVQTGARYWQERGTDRSAVLTGARYRQDNPHQCFVVESFIYIIHFNVPAVYNITLCCLQGFSVSCSECHI